MMYEIAWETYLCSSRDMVIMYVDGRGSGGRGHRWLHSVYRHLGRFEVDDTIKATK